MDNKKEFLMTEPIGKLLLKLSIPTVVAQLINMLFNIVDRIYIGHMPGDGSIPTDEIKNMINDSFELTKPKKRGKK